MCPRDWVVRQLNPDEVYEAEASAIDGATASGALQTLPLEQREAIVAHLWGGLTFEQVGELAGASSSTVHAQSQQLQQRMADDVNKALRAGAARGEAAEK